MAMPTIITPALAPAAPAAVADFQQLLHDDPELSLSVASILSLTKAIKRSQATTMIELSLELQQANRELIEGTQASVSVSAGSGLFMRFVTRASMDTPDFQACKDKLIEQGELFLQRSVQGKQRIFQLGMPFIQDGAAASANKRFSVYVTEARPAGSGYWAAHALQSAGIPVTVVLDAAMGYIVGKVDLVLVGAEGVVENGGIINQIGTYQLAIVAKAAHKPFYVVVESHKFVRQFPLNQYDLSAGSSSNLRFAHTNIKSGTPNQVNTPDDVQVLQQSIDYTPPSYITLLFTDLGVLTPSAVSDELIKLYY